MLDFRRGVLVLNEIAVSLSCLLFCFFLENGAAEWDPFACDHVAQKTRPPPAVPALGPPPGWGEILAGGTRAAFETDVRPDGTKGKMGSPSSQCALNIAVSVTS